MPKIHFLMHFVMIQLVFEVKLLRSDVNHGPARRDLIIALDLLVTVAKLLASYEQIEPIPLRHFMCFFMGNVVLCLRRPF